jgi:hypothetical protein
MKLPRRTFLRLAAGVAALPGVRRIARAQGYPSRPVHMIVATAGSAHRSGGNRAFRLACRFRQTDRRRKADISERSWNVHAGTSEIMKEIIARQILD